MHKVIAINLNGVAFQLDDTAYDALRAYLNQAEIQLKDNPDRVEIMADLEQAIAEKCSAFLSPHKTVVSAEEIEQVIREMGPVDGGGTPSDAGAGTREEAGEKQKAESSAPKRLYNIREGALVSGVCAGLAAYFHIDVTIVRVIFVILTIVTKGAWLLVYAVLMFVVPYANTTEERAAAHGQPFSAQDLIDQAKRNYSGFNEREWKRHWRDQRRAWKRQWRAAWRTGRPLRHWGPMWVPPVPAMNWPGTPGAPAGPPVPYGAQVLSGLTIPFFGILSASLFVLFIFSLVSLVNTHTIFGWPVPAEIPLWGDILMLVAAYVVVSAPLHAVRHASAVAMRQAAYPYAAWGGFLWLTFALVLVWLASEHGPELREFFRNLPGVWDSLHLR